MNNADMPANPVTIKPSVYEIRRAKDGFNNMPDNTVYKGLSKREHFAGLVMAAILSNHSGIVGKNHPDTNRDAAVAAICLADALLKELGKIDMCRSQAE